MNLDDLLMERPAEEIAEVEIELPKDELGFKQYRVHITHPSLRMRKAPNTQAEVVGLITDMGYYTIVDENNGWGKLENGNWIMLSYTEVVY